MNLNLSGIIKTVRTSAIKHSPEILTGIGIAGMITTTIMAVKATPKALQIIDEHSSETAHGRKKKPTKTEIVKLCWKCYAPATITGTLSVMCLICGSSVNAKRNAALATAYSLSESALREYSEKVVETIGEKKEGVIRDAIAKDKIDNDPVTTKEVIITDNGDVLCYDAISGRYFKSSIETLKKAENELNRRMLDEMYVSLNDFYYEIDLEGTGLGEQLGWNINNGRIDLRFSSQIAKDDRPCLVVDHRIPPKYDFAHLM